MKCQAILLSAFTLASCETTLPSEMSHTELKVLVQTIYQRCLDQKVAPGSEEMDVCTHHEGRREINTRYKNRAELAAFGDGLKDAADNYNRAANRRPVTCTSTPMGATVRTTCF